MLKRKTSADYTQLMFVSKKDSGKASASSPNNMAVKVANVALKKS